jgi:hypothetical protein
MTYESTPVVPIPPDPSDHVAKLPASEWGYPNCPAIPYWADAVGDPDLVQIENTVALLKQRAAEGGPAYCGLDTVYTIGGQTRYAYTFLYGEPLPPGCGCADVPPEPSAKPTQLPLDDPKQFTLAWTTYRDVYGDSQDLVKPFADTLTIKQNAEASFWWAISNFGLPLNLLVVEKVNAAGFKTLTKKFGDSWVDAEIRKLLAAGLLYAIDMSSLEPVGSSQAPDGTVRFAPATLTLLKQDPTSKQLTPVAIRVWTKGVAPLVYRSGDNAWLWALQAAKTSVTVWGIWLGHVYHWHTITAAMQMTMYNTLPAGHPLSPLLRAQSESLINFNYTLLTLLWGQITPPTAVDGYIPLLGLLDEFAKGRGFFDDDPQSELTARNVVAGDFTVKDDWDAYPVVKYMLEIWEHTAEFVQAVVGILYTSDNEVANDTPLQDWIAASGDSSHGNVQKLGVVQTRAALVQLLTSLLYRVNVHGASGLAPSVNPALAFVANFPPCLQSAEIPQPTDQPDLLEFLPNTGSIGGMTTFVFTFAYSPPYVSLIPAGGVDLNPWFPPAQNACNDALITFRKRIGGFVDEYVTNWNDALGKLAGRPPGSPPPAYAENQYPQWARSIEI